MIESIFLFLNITAYIILILSLIIHIAQDKLGIPLILCILSLVLFSMCAPAAMNITHIECNTNYYEQYSYDGLNVSQINTTYLNTMQCNSYQSVEEGLAVLNGGLALIAFVFIFVIIFGKDQQ